MLGLITLYLLATVCFMMLPYLWDETDKFGWAYYVQWPVWIVIPLFFLVKLAK